MRHILVTAYEYVALASVLYMLGVGLWNPWFKR